MDLDHDIALLSWLTAELRYDLEVTSWLLAELKYQVGPQNYRMHWGPYGR